MKSQVKKSQICIICRKSSPQIVCILESVSGKLAALDKITTDSDIKYWDLAPCYTNFNAYIQMIFNRLMQKEGSQTSCEHQNLKIEISQKTNISFRRLDSLSNILAWKKAKYNFHTDMITEQVKTFPSIILNMVEKPKKNFQGFQEQELEHQLKAKEPLLQKKAKESSRASTKTGKTSTYSQQLIQIKQKFASLSQLAKTQLQSPQNYKSPPNKI